LLTRYWITFKGRGDYPFYGGVFGFGVGVTAYDLDDAKQLLQSGVFDERALPEIARIISGVSYDQLQQNHVARHMGVMVIRGVWFPKGFELTK
jgi:hypothetical protein